MHYRQACHPSLLLTDHLLLLSHFFCSVFLSSVCLPLFGPSCIVLSVFLCLVCLALFCLSSSHLSVLLCSVRLAVFGVSSLAWSVFLSLVCLALVFLSCSVLSVLLRSVCLPIFRFLFTRHPLFVYLAVSISLSSLVSLTVFLSPLIYISLPPPLSIYRRHLFLCHSCVSLVLCCELCFVQAVRIRRYIYLPTYIRAISL